MTGPSLSSTSDPVVGPPLPDEAALEREFRARFTDLCAEARTHLGESAATAAPRVVEAAFRHAWEEREQLASEADLTTLLHDAIRRSAARELSRRAAAHHLGGSGAAAAHHATAAPDVDQSWAHLTRVIHPEAVRAEAQAYTEQLRHHAAEHVGDLSRERSWKVPVFIGIVAAAIAGAAMWWLTTLGADRAVTRALNSTEARTLTSNPGQTGRVTLDDSTQVTLAPGSKLTIPKQFWEEMRAVKIAGAARFAVAPGKPQPFEIRAGNAAIIATGTVIIVRAYPDEPIVTVQVTDGSATVKVNETERAVASGQAVVVDTSGALRDPSAGELAEATNWTNRRITMSRQLRDVVREMNRWYGVDIKVPELKALDTQAAIDAPLDSLRVAIGQVEQSSGLEFGYAGQSMVFRTPTKPAAKK